MCKHFTCAVVIPTSGQRQSALRECLAALKQQTYAADMTIVVENGTSQPRVRDIAVENDALYFHDPVAGANRARNVGVRLAQSEIVGFLDDDSMPTPQWLSGLCEEFRDPRVMAAVGNTLPLSISSDAERYAVAMYGVSSGGTDRLVVDTETPFWFEITNFGGIGHGNNMAFRRAVFQRWRGFYELIDRGTPLWGNGEHEAFFSVVKLGYRVVYTPVAIVRHPLPQTMEQLRIYREKDLTSVIGYFLMFLTEQPGYRWRTMKYLVEAAFGKRRHWRPHSTEPNTHRLLTIPRTVHAAVSGFSAYFLARRQYSRHPQSA